MLSAQQSTLRDAMRTLNLTRDALTERLGVSRRALDSWLLPDDSNEHRSMPTIVERFLAEILSQESKSSAIQNIGPASAQWAPHLLSVEQFNRESLEELFRVADIMQPVARRQKTCRVLEGAVLANLFLKPVPAPGSALVPLSAVLAARCVIPPALPFLPWPKVNLFMTPAG